MTTIERKCWACKKPGMEPDAPLHEGSALWMFKCPHCGARFQWIYEPAMDGSHAQKHKHKDGGFSVNSMLSDPECNVFGQQTVAATLPMKRTKRPTAPQESEKGKIIFVFDEYGNKTHRWHWGRMEWLKI